MNERTKQMSREEKKPSTSTELSYVIYAIAKKRRTEERTAAAAASAAATITET